MSKSIVIVLLLLAGSCQKRQDLVHKAFEGKNFDYRLPEKAEDMVGEPEDKTEDDQDTTMDVVVDKLVPEREETVFIQSGETTRPVSSLFEEDPDAPILNLEDAKLYDIIHALCGVLKANYIIDPSVKDQTITIGMVESDTTYKTSELFDLLLKLHDLAMVKQGSFLHIVPIQSAEVNPGLDLLYGSRSNPSLRREELSIQIIPLKYIRPADITPVIKDFLSSSARIYEEPKNNLLIVIDKQQFVNKMLELIPIFDVDVLHNKKMVFYQLAHVDAVETTQELHEILQVYGYQSEGGDRLVLVPIETLNGILVVSSTDSIFKELDFWIDKFDREAQYEEDQVFVYYVENTTADSISSTLSQIYGLQTYSGGGGQRAASNRRTTSPNLNPRDQTNRTEGQENQRPRDQITRANNFNQGGEGGPSLIVDEDNNALIFHTTHRVYSRIYKTLRKLDILPRQVFLEVTVLSVELDDTYNIGLDWSGSNEPGASETIAGGFGADGAFSTTYSYVGTTGRIMVNLAAAKSKGYANVLQQPHIMAIDNKTSTISVGTDVPIQTITTNINDLATGTGFTPATTSTIQYRQTGVTLGFTPHINANGIIRLEISLDISQAGQQVGSEAVPISQNTLDTEMIVRDNQTVVMGGLIFNQEGWGKKTVPFLDRIPLIKHLFTNRNASSKKSELIVMITPHLIDTEEKSVAISKEFKEKILKEFESFKKSRY